MPRAADGTVTLPTGNPVVAGTAISDTVHNATMADMASMVEDSLCRSGKGGMLAPLQFSDGTVAAPGVTFTNEPSTGLYRAAATDFRVSLGGADIFRLFKSGANYFVNLFTAAFLSTVKLDYTDLSASPASTVTINKPAGIVAFNAGFTGDHVTVNNSLVATTSIVHAMMRGDADATAKYIINVTISAGSFVIKVNAVPTGTVYVDFVVFN